MQNMSRGNAYIYGCNRVPLGHLLLPELHMFSTHNESIRYVLSSCYAVWIYFILIQFNYVSLTCSFDHCILPIHLGAFLHANFAPYVNSLKVSSYVPAFSMELYTSVNLVWWAGVFCLKCMHNTENNCLNSTHPD